MDFCTTRQGQTSGRLEQELNICTVFMTYVARSHRNPTYGGAAIAIDYSKPCTYTSFVNCKPVMPQDTSKLISIYPKDVFELVSYTFFFFFFFGGGGGGGGGGQNEETLML